MTGVDQAGQQVAKYRIARKGAPWRAIDITVHPDQQLTDELVLTLALTAPWISSFFAMRVAADPLTGGHARQPATAASRQPHASAGVQVVAAVVVGPQPCRARRLRVPAEARSGGVACVAESSAAVLGRLRAPKVGLRSAAIARQGSETAQGANDLKPRQASPAAACRMTSYAPA